MGAGCLSLVFFVNATKIRINTLLKKNLKIKMTEIFKIQEMVFFGSQTIMSQTAWDMVPQSIKKYGILPILK
jgi:hypothetical protein